MTKKLYRCKKERIIAGICGGIGKYFDADPVLIRLIFVLLTLMSMGMMIIFYLLAWIIMPLEK